MTHFSKYSRTTSEALRPSSLALRKTASQRSSGMRMLRSVVPLATVDRGDLGERLGQPCNVVLRQQDLAVAVFAADFNEPLAGAVFLDVECVAVCVGGGEQCRHWLPLSVGVYLQTNPLCTHTQVGVTQQAIAALRYLLAVTA